MNVLKLIEDAGTGPGVERKSQNLPLFVGKRVIHTFEEGKWNGRVVSVVKGYPDFYNSIYDSDVEDTSTPTGIYTYKLKKDYKYGNLEIIPDVVSYRSCSSSSSALQLTNLLTRCHHLIFIRKRICMIACCFICYLQPIRVICANSMYLGNELQVLRMTRLNDL